MRASRRRVTPELFRWGGVGAHRPMYLKYPLSSAAARPCSLMPLDEHHADDGVELVSGIARMERSRVTMVRSSWLSRSWVLSGVSLLWAL